MSGFRTPEQPRGQSVLWAHRLEDAIPQDHPVRLLDYLLHSEAFDETFTAWAGEYALTEGKPPYHPRDLSALYLYGMMNRIRSSRQLESACHNRLDVIWLMQSQKPDHSTVASFVRKYGKHLRKLFRNVLGVAVRAGLVGLDNLAVDGTKIEADAGKSSVRSEKKIASWLSHLDEKIAALEAEWSENERREALLFGDRAPWVPPKSRTEKHKLAKLQRQRDRLDKALQEIERRRQEHPSGKPPKAIASTTAPESRCMKDKEGRSKPNYNGQAAVDDARGVIVAEEVNDQPTDSGLLTPLVKQSIENCGQKKPRAVSADSQYNTGPELASMEEEGVISYLPDSGQNSEAARADEAAGQALEAVAQGQTLTNEQWEALPKSSGGLIDKSAFRYDQQKDEYRCPAGRRLRVLGTSRDAKKWGTAIRRQYGHPTACASCERAAKCCKAPAKGRVINRDQYEDHRQRLRERMATEVGRVTYGRRKHTVEPRFGQIKHVLGVRRFMRRGLEAVRTEWSLVCTAVNIGILLRHWKEVVPIL
jgi:transposase